MPKASLHDRLAELVDELTEAGIPLKQAKDQFERHCLLAALRQNGGNMRLSAGQLGIHRNTLRNRMTSLSIKPSEYRMTGTGRKRR